MQANFMTYNYTAVILLWNHYSYDTFLVYLTAYHHSILQLAYGIGIYKTEIDNIIFQNILLLLIRYNDSGNDNDNEYTCSVSNNVLWMLSSKLVCI